MLRLKFLDLSLHDIIGQVRKYRRYKVRGYIEQHFVKGQRHSTDILRHSKTDLVVGYRFLWRVRCPPKWPWRCQYLPIRHQWSLALIGHADKTFYLDTRVRWSRRPHIHEPGTAIGESHRLLCKLMCQIFAWRKTDKKRDISSNVRIRDGNY